jgi:hypothetical protein
LTKLGVGLVLEFYDQDHDTDDKVHDDNVHVMTDIYNPYWVECAEKPIDDNNNGDMSQVDINLEVAIEHHD